MMCASLVIRTSFPHSVLWCRMFFPVAGRWEEFTPRCAQSQTERNLMLAVDLPFVESRFLSHLIACARESAAMVIVPYGGGRWQPLCAIYQTAIRRDCGGIAPQRRKSNRRPARSSPNTDHSRGRHSQHGLFHKYASKSQYSRGMASCRSWNSRLKERRTSKNHGKIN